MQECASAPCQNGAQCVEMLNGYRCSCAAGYAGMELMEGVIIGGIVERGKLGLGAGVSV